MLALSRLQYYRRVFAAYSGLGKSQLTFWHDLPGVNPNCSFAELGEYYMPFFEKANYSGLHDADGIPLLDYRGRIGQQYNPIAIAQWGLGNYNLFQRTNEPIHRRKFTAAADWLCRELKANQHAIAVWNHYFDWEYRSRLRSPWYSGLAQGQGISLLVRTFRQTRECKYLECAERAFASFCKPTHAGGISFTDEHGDVWFEEYIVSPPTHILNGFIWAAWGVYDLFLTTGNQSAQDLFARAAVTLRKNLHRYDLGFWSLYEQSGTRMPMLASPFYHRLHIVQLKILARLTGENFFLRYADKWETYSRSRSKRTRALCYKSAFKLCYY